MTATVAMEMTVGSLIAKHPLLAAASFATLTATTTIAGVALRRWQRRSRSLHRSLLVVVFSSLCIATAAAVLAARLLVLSHQELAGFLGMATVSTGLAILPVVVVTQPMARDARHLESTVRDIEAGDRSVRVGDRRNDELGHVGHAIDELVSRLATLENERAAIEEERRTLLSNIGHDLRSPLAALQAATEAMIDGVAPDPQRYLRSMSDLEDQADTHKKNIDRLDQQKAGEEKKLADYVGGLNL